MPRERILVLGGTRDARTICDALHAAGHDVTLSLAGVTQAPEPVSCQVRTGGFGGAHGLRDYLVQEKISVLIDATHPFAAQISANATAAVQGLNIRHLRLERPHWSKPLGAEWITVASPESAAAILPAGAKIFLATGRKNLGLFFNRTDVTGVVRMIEPPAEQIPPHWRLILARPPTSLEDEIELLRAHQITHLVCKDSGGPTTHKLQAAAQMGIPAIMIARPEKRGGEVLNSLEVLIAKLDQGRS